MTMTMLREDASLSCRPSNDPQLMSYRSFLDSFLLPPDASGPDADKRNSEVKNRRQTLKRTFTEPGQPGEMFRCTPCHLASVSPHN